MIPPTSPLHPYSIVVLGTVHTPTTTRSIVGQNNIYDVLTQQGSGIADKDIDKLSFGSISGVNTSTSGSKDNKGRDPTPLTPKILERKK